MGLARNWKPVIDKVSSKLSTWKAKNLSLGGRVTLCKSVLGSIPLYFLSLFKAPVKVIDSIETLRRRFIWGINEQGRNKISWISWQKTIAPKNLGGLGIGSLQVANRALLCKWWWRMLNNDSDMWVKVIRSFHGLTGTDVASIIDSKKLYRNQSYYKIFAVISFLSIFHYKYTVFSLLHHNLLLKV